MSLKHQGKVSDDYGCTLLEQAVKLEILQEVLLAGTDISSWNNFHKDVLKVGCNLEQLQILHGGNSTYQCSSGGGAYFLAVGTQPGAGAPMDISTACQGQQQQRDNPHG